jgi:DNA invertase Pin-like site-specific DNA recombinase
MAAPIVCYYRVSTQRQSRSGLGLEAQQRAVRQYLKCGDWRVVAEFTEAESGTRSERPKLARAIKVCRAYSATLIIAKLDRLARNVAFVCNLMESGVKFAAADFPEANHLTIHILAAFAEHEARLISERTKAALAAAKARGVKLGGYHGSILTQKARLAGSRARKLRANRRAADLAPLIQELRQTGATSLHALARALNAREIPTSRGRGRWGASQVRRVLARLPEKMKSRCG